MGSYSEGIRQAFRETRGMVKDNVNSPSHYNQHGVECIEAIRASLGDEFESYCKGNVIKYLWRYQYKNGLEDLKKAQVYLNWMIKSVEEASDVSSSN